MLTLLLILVAIGFIWWLAETYIPMAPPMKAIIRVVCLLAVVVYLLRWARLI